MIPSKKAIETAFDIFNKKYFGNQLPKPTFSTACPTDRWAYFKPFSTMRQIGGRVISYSEKPGILALSSSYSRAEKDILNSLLHEMIHIYVFCIKKRVLKDPHGNIFKAKAAEINKDGWEISEKNDVKTTDKINNGRIKASDKWKFDFATNTPHDIKSNSFIKTPNQQSLNINQNALNSMMQQIKKINQMIEIYKQNLNK